MKPTSHYYAANAEQYAKKNNRQSVMKETRKTFLKHLPSGARIHDYGCGTGRDLFAFQQAGYVVCGFDFSGEMLEEAVKWYPSLTGHVNRLDFLSDSWDVAPKSCDGFWACASLLHVKHVQIEGVLKNIANTLVDDGIGYISVKTNEISEWSNIDGRYFQFWNVDEFKEIVLSVFNLVSIEETKTDEANWLNLILKKKPLVTSDNLVINGYRFKYIPTHHPILHASYVGTYEKPFRDKKGVCYTISFHEYTLFDGTILFSCKHTFRTIEGFVVHFDIEFAPNLTIESVEKFLDSSWKANSFQHERKKN